VKFSEGQLVRCTNPKYSHYGWAYVQATRGMEARVEFRPTVFSKSPFTTIIEVLPLAEIQPIKDPVQRLMETEFDEPWTFEMKQRAAHMVVCNRIGQLSNILMEFVPHQIAIVHTVLSTPKRRFLIAEEVGMGKTL
jgi:hypothetical protein